MCRCTTGDVDELFAEATRQVFSVIVANLAEVRPVETVRWPPLTRTATRRTDVASSACELLYLFDTGGCCFAGFDVSVGPEGLQAEARGEPNRFRKGAGVDMEDARSDPLIGTD